jgi:hypothetical protein
MKEVEAVAKDKADDERLMRLMRDAPDNWPVTDDETCGILGVSRDTLFRMDKAGIGPKIIRLAKRRKARTVGSIRQLIAERAAAPSS